MAEKWNAHPSDMFGEFNRSDALGNTSQVQDISASNNMHPAASVNGQIHDSQEIIMQPRNSYTNVESSSNAKETCMETSMNCTTISHNNCQIIPNNNEVDHQSTDEQKSLKQNKGQPSNVIVCFICCTSLLDENGFLSIKTFMNHSHAPLLVLLIDVLGYKLDSSAKLHSQVVCKSCYHLLDIIDELQQTLAESKTDLRTKFLDTVQRLKLKYPRTDKMLRPRCLRCVQMTQSTSRRKQRGCRGAKGKGTEDASKGRGKGRGNGRPSSDNSEAATEGEIGSPSQGNAGSDCDAHGDSSTPGSHKEHASADSHQDQSPVEQPSANIIFDTDPMFFSPDEKLKAGFARETEAGTTTYLCMYCNAVYENSIALKMHVRVYHMPVLVYDNGQGTAETRYRMGIKLQHTTSNEMCTTEKPYACLFCPSAYKLQSSLQFHFRENHSPHKPYPCQECKESFRRTIELSRHRLYRCPLRKPQVVQPKR